MAAIVDYAKDTGKAAEFARAFLAAYLTPAFGARSKSEIELLVFSALVEAKLIDPDRPTYELSRALNITPARVRALVFNWQLRSEEFRSDLTQRLRDALQRTRFGKDGTFLTFGVESPILKEEIVARLKQRGVYSDASFAREIVRLPVDAFVEFLDDLVDEKTKRDFKQRLVKDGLVKDASFKAVALGVLGKLGEKVAGDAGDAVANEIVAGVGPLVTMLTGLFKGDGDDAAEAVRVLIA